MIMTNELEELLKEAVVASFQLQFWNLPGTTD